jgi:hypothetical protein
MNKLKGECLGMYVSRNGNETFRYKVTGSPEALTAYEEAQGEYYTVDDATGNVLWFTTRYAGETATIVVTDAGKIYADMSEFAKQASLAKQFGGNLGQELARSAAEKLLGKPVANSTPAQQPAEKKQDGGALGGF